jgi:hypothetical protein
LWPYETSIQARQLILFDFRRHLLGGKRDGHMIIFKALSTACTVAIG